MFFHHKLHIPIIHKLIYSFDWESATSLQLECMVLAKKFASTGIFIQLQIFLLKYREFVRLIESIEANVCVCVCGCVTRSAHFQPFFRSVYISAYLFTLYFPFEFPSHWQIITATLTVSHNLGSWLNRLDKDVLYVISLLNKQRLDCYFSH